MHLIKRRINERKFLIHEFTLSKNVNSSIDGSVLFCLVVSCILASLLIDDVTELRFFLAIPIGFVNDRDRLFVLVDDVITVCCCGDDGCSTSSGFTDDDDDDATVVFVCERCIVLDTMELIAVNEASDDDSISDI